MTLMLNKTAMVKVLNALGFDATAIKSVSINDKEIFNAENSHEPITIEVSRYIVDKRK